jgi:hypothetical protein
MTERRDRWLAAYIQRRCCDQRARQRIEHIAGHASVRVNLQTHSFRVLLRVELPPISRRLGYVSTASSAAWRL